MKAGDVALVALPQADGVEKLRPALLLCGLPSHGDWLACGVSTQIHQAVPGFDEVVGPSDEDFSASGLRAPSVIRLGFLAALPAARFTGAIGRISDLRLRRLRGRLAEHLAAPP